MHKRPKIFSFEETDETSILELNIEHNTDSTVKPEHNTNLVKTLEINSLPEFKGYFALPDNLNMH